MTTARVAAPAAAPQNCFLSHRRRYRRLISQALRTKTRIHVPKGCCLIGIMDETALLRYGEVFFVARPEDRATATAAAAAGGGTPGSAAGVGGGGGGTNGARDIHFSGPVIVIVIVRT